MGASWKNIFFITLILSVICFRNAGATHLRAADIVVEPVCGTLTYKITVIVYLNAASSTPFGANSQIFFGDGFNQVIPVTPSTPRPDLGENIKVATFTTTHTYASTGIFTITYMERDRSTGILNIVNSHDVPYVTSVTINTDPKYGCNHFPVLSVIPLDRGCSGVAFYHSPGASDPEGDSLSFEMTMPASGVGIFADYTSPDNAKFYTDFNKGNETKDGQPFIRIDTTGTVTWNAPGAMGEYNIAFKVIEWRRNTNTNEYEVLSTTIRDMQIIIVDQCNNVRPELLLPENICVVAGHTVTGTIEGTDPENHPVKIEVFSEILDLENSPASYTPDDGAFGPSDPPAKIYFKWNTECLHVRQQPYQVVFKITDNPPNGPKLVTFQTWTIRVVAPPPVIDDVSLDVVKNFGVLNWDHYTCSATKIQVWRKVGSFSGRPNNCVTGIPANSGYSLLTETEGNATAFTDTNNGTGLLPGATYCYRLVALIADAKSIVSEEFCIGPVVRDAPVITNVSVEKTGEEDGALRVRWAPPVDLKAEQFPPPYQYEVYRANDFIGENGIIHISTTSDTSILDAGLNTADKVFNYRIVVYSKPKFSDDFIAVDTSAQASSVKLSATAGVKQIALQWRDSVPWTNVADERPYHLIYRGTDFAKDDELTLIDSVQIVDNGFKYVDKGQFNNQPLNDHTIYSYRIVTIGSYGNDELGILKNASQTIFIYPENNLKPCAPFVDLKITDCQSYHRQNNCNETSFTNILQWQPNTYDTCRIDIASYNVYASTVEDTAFVLLANVDTIGFTDRNLPSPIRCYKISAVDKKGQEGPLSESRCNDSCPFYTLPNVFTPNGDTKNETFTSGHATIISGTDEVVDNAICPRFVKSVNLKVYNRWGRQVYHYYSNSTDGIYIDWDGKDEHGTELPAGVYYYVAEVEFNALNKDRRRTVLKDWLHLLR